jgi:hypothetical protein
MHYSKHHKTAEIAKLPRAMIAGGAAVVLLVAAALTLTAPQPSTRKALPEFSMPAPVTPMRAAKSDEKPLRLVYRNSVVPGGVHSAAELAEVMQRDPIAAAHYANFNVAKAHLVQVEQSRMVHVSYRIGNQIYWTKNKVRLALGEYLLSDGEHLIRARCGNRIADTVQGPVLINEPAPEVLETAFVSADDLIDKNVSMAALGGLPAQPGVVNGGSPVPTTATPAPPFSWDRYGMPALVSIPTLPGVTVVGTRPGAPALLVDGVVTAPPLSTPVDNTVPVSTPVDVVTPLTPNVPLAPSLPSGDTGGTPTTPTTPTTPIVIDTPLPKPDAPGTPFIEEPTFTPAPPIVPVQQVNGEAPEPGSAVLALMALAMLYGARRLRRAK